MRQTDKPEPTPREIRALGDYQVHVAREGFASIRQISSGEIMHSRTPPMEEAQKLYIEQSRLATRIQLETGQDPKTAVSLTIWDVGLGAAANAMAAVLCYETQAELSSVRPLRIISFENDLDSLRLAFHHPDHFPYLRHSGPAGILNDGTWQSRQHPGLTWLLWPGDFADTMSKAPAPPDLIFYDMFSSRTSSELWTLNTFRNLFAICAEHGTELFTYTRSTANRAALLAAGFYVARGRNAGEKLETTIALTPGVFGEPWFHRRDLLANSWLEKWNRSRAKFPEGMPASQRTWFERTIRAHPQFQGGS